MLVVVHNSRRPAPEEWVRYCDLVETNQSLFTGQVVLSKGPGPDATQRQQVLDRLPQGYVIPLTAVFTDSALARGLVTLFNWFTPNAMRAFSPEDLTAAARHLRISEEHLRRLVDIARALMPEEP